MEANTPDSEIILLDDAVKWLGERLPANWSIERTNIQQSDTGASPDWAIDMTGPSASHTRFAVEARQSLTPREAMNLLPRLAQVLRSMAGTAPVLVIAPWLSRRTQEMLAEQQMNYLDLTGNALLRLDYPPLFIQSQGATRNPAPRKRGRAQLRGGKAARLIRLLTDVRPPYNVSEMADATHLAPGYVSRLVDTLYRESLIERAPRGPIESVDVQALLRRWASSYDVFKSNATETFIAPEGIDDLLSRLASDPGAGTRIAITGSVAASRLAPVAAPALLVGYYDAPGVIARDFGLLPADEGANVAFLRPFDQIVWQRTEIKNGLRFAAPSQVAVDCLTGNGRMPSEGEALLDWMEQNESVWRIGSLEQFKSEWRP